MKTKSLLLLFPLLLLSCVSILKNTVGRVIQTKSEKEFVFKKNTQVEFDYEIDNGHIVLRISNNKIDTLSFLFDTGARRTIISENTAIRLGGVLTNKTQNAIDIHSVGKIAKVYFFDSIQFNNLLFCNLKLMTMDKLPQGANGIIGIDFMANKIVSINSTTKKITFCTKKLNRSKTNSIKMKKKWDGRYYVTTKIENKNYNLLFDTGYDSFISIEDTIKLNSQKIASYLGMRVGLNSKHYRFSNLHFVPFVTLGNFENGNEPILVNHEFGLKKVDELLGLSLFLNQNVDFDFIEKRIYFEKLNGNSPNKYYPPINFYIRDGLRIFNLEKKVFDETGMLPDDKIFAINKFKVPINDLDINDFLLKKEYRIYKDSLELEILRGDSSFVKKIKWEYID